MSLLPEEKEVICLLANVWNAFLLLSVSHGDDIDDFRYAIHAAQRIVLARMGRRGLDDANS